MWQRHYALKNHPSFRNSRCSSLFVSPIHTSIQGLPSVRLPASLPPASSSAVCPKTDKRQKQPKKLCPVAGRLFPARSVLTHLPQKKPKTAPCPSCRPRVLRVDPMPLVPSCPLLSFPPAPPLVPPITIPRLLLSGASVGGKHSRKFLLLSFPQVFSGNPEKTKEAVSKANYAPLIGKRERKNPCPRERGR